MPTDFADLLAFTCGFKVSCLLLGLGNAVIDPGKYVYKLLGLAP